MPAIRVVNISDQQFSENVIKIIQIKKHLQHMVGKLLPTLPWQLWHWISEFPQMDDVRILHADLKRRMGHVGLRRR